MHAFTTTLFLTLTTPTLLSCGQQQSAPDVDPKVGFACFEFHRPTLPPGTQYEGIGQASADRVTIRVMTGLEVTTVTCKQNPDGTPQGAGH